MGRTAAIVHLNSSSLYRVMRQALINLQGCIKNKEACPSFQVFYTEQKKTGSGLGRGGSPSPSCRGGSGGRSPSQRIGIKLDFPICFLNKSNISYISLVFSYIFRHFPGGDKHLLFYLKFWHVQRKGRGGRGWGVEGTKAY